MDYKAIVAAVKRSQDEVAGKALKHIYNVSGYDGGKPEDEYVACPYREGDGFDITDEMDDQGKGSGFYLCGGCGADVESIIESAGEYRASQAEKLRDDLRDSH